MMNILLRCDYTFNVNNNKRYIVMKKKRLEPYLQPTVDTIQMHGGETVLDAVSGRTSITDLDTGQDLGTDATGGAKEGFTFWQDDDEFLSSIENTTLRLSSNEE